MSVRSLFIVLVAITAFGAAFAQSGNFRGTVYDENGEPLEGANVFVVEARRGAATDENGKFVISNLPAGTYRVEVSFVGYRSVSLPDVRFEAGRPAMRFRLEPETVSTAPVVVAGAKYEQSVDELPVSALVIDPDTFRENNFVTLDEALRYVPGVSMNEEQLSVRGSSGYSHGAGTRVMLAIDGVPIYTGDTGEIIWEIVPLTDVERVEVIKGPASSLYGSTAIGGVVNVVTRRVPDEPITHVRAFGGFYNPPKFDEWKWSDRDYRSFHGLGVSHARRVGDLGVSLSAQKLDDDGYKIDGFYKRWLFYGKLAYDLGEGSSLKLIGENLFSNNGQFLFWKDSRNALVENEADIGTRIESSRGFLVGIYKERFSDALTTELKSSWYHTEFEGKNLARSTSMANLYRNEILGHATFGDLDAVLGGEAVYAMITSEIFANPEFFSWAAYGQTDYRAAKGLNLSAGVRLDAISMDTLHAEEAFSPRVGINYRPTDEVILRGLFARGFRAPTPAEIYTTISNSGLEVRENTDLVPESSVSFEFGARWRPSGEYVFDASFFNNEYDDYIEANLNPDGTIQFVNLTEARIQGVEAIVEAYPEWAPAQFSAGYTYLWTRDLNLDRAMKYRPRHMLYLSASARYGAFELGANFRYLSRVEEIDRLLTQPPLVVVPDGDLRVAIYSLDLRVGASLAGVGVPARVNLNAKNVFNYRYVEMIGNLAPPRSLSMSFDIYF
ncbi:MAG: TonB-dependent receptor [Ignavibacteriales bacterium]|nr:TonB-dependent receptor [Ignavibacteriales bacterium]